MDYIQKKRYRDKNGMWYGEIELIDNDNNFPSGMPYNKIRVQLWNREELREEFVENEYKRQADRHQSKFLEPEREKEIFYSKTEVTNILREKKYLESNEYFSEDMEEKIIEVSK